MPHTGILLGKDLQNREGFYSALERPKQTAFGRPLFRSLPSKAAALFHALIANHPFIDGNKRTAVLAMHDFLWVNGRMVLASNDDMIELALKVADRRGQPHEQLVKELTTLLGQTCKPIASIPRTATNKDFLDHCKFMAGSIRDMLKAPEDELKRAYIAAIAKKFGN